MPPRKKEDTQREIADFTYYGKSLFEMKPVSRERSEKALREMDLRIRAMYRYCQENKLVMTSAHFAAVLGITKDEFGAWKNNRAKSELPVDLELRRKTKEFNEARSNLLQIWYARAEMSACDRTCTDEKAAGPIYIAKACFKLWDRPTEKGEKSEDSLEQLLSKLENLKTKKAAGK